MALRPPLLQRTLSAFSLTRGAPIAPNFLLSHERFNTTDNRPPPPPPPPPPSSPRAPPDLSSISLSSFFGDSAFSRPRQTPQAESNSEVVDAEFPSFSGVLPASVSEENTFHLCVYATKHNTHLSFTKPNKDTILTMSCGNVGFTKSKRGTFEAAYELTSVMLSKMEVRGLRPRNLEIVFRDFGPGRDAFTKALLGKEGKWLRGSIRKVTDASRLKFGGTRSRAKRRL